ncbi:hypothetical protein [Cellulomonas cellasea]|uniref:Uncharacterized protein n=1 Tax=Cellulomonas cellasea TaxID=43670 RepID=A0A7W4YCK1_9CELL|nr:hypothetical protein [Cellulomonas cellasea]MBB2924189.1 hypothetical protein [Cellulomonas cellasea]
MSTRLLLEGGDLAELMVHVREEFGPGARIVRAERIRTGGVAGFFARERYELTVEVPEPPRPRPRALRQGPQPAAAGPVGIDALLAAAEAAEADDPASLSTGAAAGSVPVDDGVPRVSTGAESFASVLEQVRAMAGGQPLPADVEVPAPAERVFSPLAPPAVPGRTEDDAVVPVVLPAAPVPAPVIDAAATPVVGGSREALVRLGVPARLLADLPAGAPATLSGLLAHVPDAPHLVRMRGSVVVVVGRGEDAMTVAGQLAERLRQAPAGIVLAGEVEHVPGRGRRLTTPAAAERWRTRSGESGDVALVVLGVGPEPEDRSHAAAILAALDADQVWGVVDARDKARDCERWLTEVGAQRAVDVLAVRGLFETTEPGTVLDLPVPVAWIDGIPATRVAWAAALSQHLGHDARWD